MSCLPTRGYDANHQATDGSVRSVDQRAIDADRIPGEAHHEETRLEGWDLGRGEKRDLPCSRITLIAIRFIQFVPGDASLLGKIQDFRLPYNLG